jgi:AcrR family transcriptional regulator
MRSAVSRTERRRQTREELVGAADRLFTEQGFHATSLDQIAAAAGYTKGAVYSNFESKEDLFFAVYERRVEDGVAMAERVLEERGAREGLRELGNAAVERRGRQNGWLAVFFEFWAHVVRHPEHRERFATLHGRAQAPLTAAAGEAARDGAPALSAERITVAMMAMMTGLALESLVRPDIVDGALADELSRLVMDGTFREAS